LPGVILWGSRTSALLWMRSLLVLVDPGERFKVGPRRAPGAGVGAQPTEEVDVQVEQRHPVVPATCISGLYAPSWKSPASSSQPRQ
jgi:hypothetical protein